MLWSCKVTGSCITKFAPLTYKSIIDFKLSINKYDYFTKPHAIIIIKEITSKRIFNYTFSTQKFQFTSKHETQQQHFTFFCSIQPQLVIIPFNPF